MTDVGECDHPPDRQGPEIPWGWAELIMTTCKDCGGSFCREMTPSELQSRTLTYAVILE